MGKKRLLALVTIFALMVGFPGLVPGLIVPAATAAPGSSANSDLPVVLRSATLQVRGTSPEAVSAQGADLGERALYLVQFTSPIRDDFKEALFRLGVEIGDYLPYYSFLVRMTPDQVPQVASLPHVGGVVLYEPGHKLDADLQDVQGSVTVRITGFGADAAALPPLLQQAGAQVAGVAPGQAVATVDAEQLAALTRSDAVVFIEREQTPVLLNDKAVGIMEVPVLWAEGLDGSGQVIGVADTGIDSGRNDSSMHADLQGRIQAVHALGRAGDASDTHGHGTHVAGSIVGTGAAGNGQSKGSAPGAKLVFQAVGDRQGGLSGIPADLGQLFGQARNSGAHIHSNSWGVPSSAGGSGIYDSQAQAVDRFVWENDMLILFAAGNDGGDSRSGERRYGTVSTPGTAKNALTVGASENLRPDRGQGADNPNEIAIFSSRGPTKDGRIKPDVVAPGTWILSARARSAPQSNFWAIENQHYAYMGGTSMATPLTAGAVALVRQYFLERHDIVPRPALLKATVINGAVTLAGANVKDQGWGRVDLTNLGNGLQFVNEATALSTGEHASFSYAVDGGAPLRVTLVWTDYPGNPNSGKALVNDLDLVVVGPDGREYVGNAHVEGQNGRDRLNNVENVIIANPAPGAYTVRVEGHNVPQGPQPFALAISGTERATEPVEPPEPPEDPTEPPPGVRLEHPTTGAVVQGTVELRASVDGEVSHVEFYLGQQRLGRVDQAPYLLNWDTTAAADGEHTLMVRAHAPDGRTAEDSVRIVVANQHSEAHVRQTFTGYLFGLGSSRFVALDAGPGTLDLALSWSGSSYVTATLYDATGRLVATADGRNGRLQMQTQVAADGIYNLAITNWGGPVAFQAEVGYSLSRQAVEQQFSGRVGGWDMPARSHLVQHGQTGPLYAALNWDDATADLDLYVYDSRGYLVARAATRGLRPETLATQLPAGTYYLWVVASTNGQADYTLAVTHRR